MTDYFVYHFQTAADQQESLIALLSNWPFDGFEQDEQGERLKAYLPQNAWTSELEKALQALSGLPISYSRETLPGTNWNALWESNFTPISIGSFCYIYADFHPVKPGFQHYVCITPRMAFGTGHHPTTRMMIMAMRKLDFSHQSVLDYGCGTGVLSIVAHKMGSQTPVAIDIDPASTENTRFNAAQNDCPVEVKTGDLDHLPSSVRFSILLANINRNVILKSLTALYDLLAPGGHLICSGFLIEDRSKMEQAFAEYPWQLTHTETEGEWLCMTWKRD